MVYLLWLARDFGVGQPEGTVKARYATLEEAKAQAEHDLTLGRHPLRIVSEDGTKVLWAAPEGA